MDDLRWFDSMVTCPRLLKLDVEGVEMEVWALEQFQPLFVISVYNLGVVMVDV